MNQRQEKAKKNLSDLLHKSQAIHEEQTSRMERVSINRTEEKTRSSCRYSDALKFRTVI